MNWNILPDLLALTALVAVFVSLLPRKTDSSLRLSVIGWILIVVHFAALFSDVSRTRPFTTFITLGTLNLAGLAFMWSAVSRRLTWHGASAFAAIALPQIAYIGLSVGRVSSTLAYVAVAFAGFAFPALVIMRAVPNRTERLLSILSCALLVGSLLVVLRFDSDPSDGIVNILTWVYLGAGILHWRRAGRATTASLTLVAGFLAWGLVFPIGFALDTWLPALHIDATAYNIPKYVVAIGIILTLLEEQMARSLFLAHHDELTGLPNRRMLEERVEDALERATRSGLKVALFAIDLDRFKTINDSFGHTAGDGFLRDVAARFAGRMRKIDTCARYGGDEFMVLADQLQSRADAERIARDLAATLSEPIAVGGQLVRASASIGTALFPDDGRDLETLYAVSDAAMYAGKDLPARGAPIRIGAAAAG